MRLSYATKPSRGEAATRATSPGGHAESLPAAHAAVPETDLVTVGSERSCVASRPFGEPYARKTIGPSWWRPSMRAFRPTEKPRLGRWRDPDDLPNNRA
jgi:hypothetical protein